MSRVKLSNVSARRQAPRNPLSPSGFSSLKQRYGSTILTQLSNVSARRQAPRNPLSPSGFSSLKQRYRSTILTQVAIDYSFFMETVMSASSSPDPNCVTVEDSDDDDDDDDDSYAGECSLNYNNRAWVDDIDNISDRSDSDQELPESKRA
ncbi:hypothetical protein HF521_021518 [Silurus meridionalis]|uniref:Uncharacterized protein n=1 Tax=Silurus meridionalis TaxID=175797 RepID=A0A8T0BG03_SILME|nr:hypothetical protein HF521_021518 [Silurus meridionalis]